MKNLLEQIKTFMLSEAFSGISWWIVITVAAVIAIALIVIAIVVNSKKKKKAKQIVANESSTIVNPQECNTCSDSSINIEEDIKNDVDTDIQNDSNSTIEKLENTNNEENITPLPTQDIQEQTEENDKKDDTTAIDESNKNEENTDIEPTKKDEDSTESVVEEKVEPVKTSNSKQNSFKINAKSTQKKSPITTLSEENQTSFGKYVIIKKENEPLRPYCFRLLANNGQLLFESELYKVKPKKNSIEAFKRSASKRENFIVDDDKNNTYRYKLYNNNGNMIGVGETYLSKQSCLNAVESVIRFAQSATVVEDLTVANQDNTPEQEESKEE